MNSAIAASINGGISNQQVANGSCTSLLLSSVEFSLTEVKTNFSAAASQGKYLIKLTGKEILNGQNKHKVFEQNKNSTENSTVLVNGNKEKHLEDTIPAPKVQLFTGKINVEWNKTSNIGAGLHNFGNTCFMNTVLQCLTYCPPLANYLLHNNDHASNCTAVGFCMMCLLQRHMKMVLRNSGGVISPLELNKKLRLIAKHFHTGRQEDAHEYLRYVIDHLWKTCIPLTNGASKLDPASKETTVINKIFGGYHRSQVICLRCKTKSNTYDHFMEFMLDIKNNVGSLQKALEKFTQPELLQQDNCYRCPKCKMKVEAQKRFTVYQAPVVATFQLKRFDYNRAFGGKITKFISYPEKLDLRPYMSEPQGEPVLYYLNAVLVHTGNSCNSGHYYCFVKNSNGHWYRMNDEQVSKVDLQQVLGQCAYVLFYIKMQETAKLPLKKNFENKSNNMKETFSNSHFSKVSETNGLRPAHVFEETSQTADSKLSNSSNNPKKIDFAATNREKISFGFRTNGPATLVASPKSKVNPPETVSNVHGATIQMTSPENKTNSSEIVSISRGALVPYIKDSSESSNSSDGSDLNSNIKSHSKQKSLDNHQASPLIIKAKPSKSVISPSPIPKVSATGSWIVTDVPQTLSCHSSNSNGVNSTTDWQVIEASDSKSVCSPKLNDNSFNNTERSLHTLHTPEHSTNGANLANLSVSVEKSPNDSNSSSVKRDIRKQLCNGESEEMNTFKRKYSESSAKASNNSSLFHYNDSKHSPLPKKTKYAENSSFLNPENDIRNSNSITDNTSDSAPVQKLYVNGDIRSRTNVIDRVSNLTDSFKSSPRKNGFFNGAKHDKDAIFSKGKQVESSLESKSEKSSSNLEKNSLYGADVPTWREESHYKSSVPSTHERRRSFDDYDKDFDSGKTRKSKGREQNRFFRYKSPRQTYYESCSRKHNGKFHNNHHYPRRRDSNYIWKTNHSNNYHYRSHHRRY